ncbi:MAG: DNA methyltransferase, partial [Solirubrobacteraceae bacterium]
KPVELYSIPIRNHTKAGDAIYEPFAGSGSAIIAAEMADRRCLAIDIEPRYVQVAIERWQAFTGLTAERLVDG